MSLPYRHRDNTVHIIHGGRRDLDNGSSLAHRVSFRGEIGTRVEWVELKAVDVFRRCQMLLDAVSALGSWPVFIPHDGHFSVSYIHCSSVHFCARPQLRVQFMGPLCTPLQCTSPAALCIVFLFDSRTGTVRHAANRLPGEQVGIVSHHD